MHGRSRVTIRPSHPYNAGTEHVGYSPTRQTRGGSCCGVGGSVGGGGVGGGDDFGVKGPQAFRSGW